MTLLLTRSQVVGLIDAGEILAALRAGFAAPPAEVRPLRARTDLPAPGTATALLPGLVPGVPAYTVKVNAKFPGAAPALRGVVCLHSLDDGALLAVLDSAAVTAWRTGLAAALATDVLAAQGAGRMAVIGAGAQAGMALHGLSRLRTLSGLAVCDTDPDRAAAFAAEHRRRLAIPAATAATAREAAAQADIVLLATWSRSPLLDTADLRPGLHLTSLGADEPGKAELSAGVLRRARTVVDDAALAAEAGALGTAGLPAEAAHAALGEVLRGERAGRDRADQVTAYTPVGLPWQDLALAWPVYQAARAAGTGTEVDFGA